MIRLKVSKRPGMEKESVLTEAGGGGEEQGGEGGIWESLQQR